MSKTFISANLAYGKFMTVEHFGITSFLQQYNGNKTIDLLLIDVEGAEYGILPVLVCKLLKFIVKMHCFKLESWSMILKHNTCLRNTAIN